MANLDGSSPDPNERRYELKDGDEVLGVIVTYHDVSPADLAQAVQDIRDGLITVDQVAGQFYGHSLPLAVS